MYKNSTHFTANFSGETSGSPSSTRVPKELAIAFIPLVAISILAGLVGNAWVCMLLRERRALRKVPHFFLGNLAANGVFSSLFGMPLPITMTIVNYFDIRDMLIMEIFCKVSFVSQYSCMTVNALTLWIMAFDRLDCVLHPLKRRVTTGNAKALVVVTWIGGIIAATLFAISIRNEPSVCTEFYPYNKDIRKYGGVFRDVLAVFGQCDKITVLIVIVTFVRIMKAYRSSSFALSNSSHRRREKKLIRLTFNLCGVFLFFRGLLIFSHVLTPEKFAGIEVAKIAKLVTDAMANFVFVANPILHRRILIARKPNRVITDAKQAGEPMQMTLTNISKNQTASGKGEVQTLCIAEIL